MAQDSQIYEFFLDNPPSNQFLFRIRIIKNFRPKVGDSITDPITQRSFRVMKDIVNQQGGLRVTDDGRIRITDDGRIRVTNLFFPNEDLTHKYFVQPADNPQRISTWTRSDYANDQTLRQLYR